MVNYAVLANVTVPVGHCQKTSQTPDRRDLCLPTWLVCTKEHMTRVNKGVSVRFR